MNLPIRVRGHSGFVVSVVNEHTIRKAGQGPDSRRLRRQIARQNQFQAGGQTARIRTPKVFHEVETADGYHADMEFIAAQDFVQFLTEASRNALDDFAGLITEHIRGNVQASADRDVAEPVRNKARELSEKGVPRPYVDAVLALAAAPVIIPVGPCHGDLTFSNILFKQSHIYLIDFLDVFVESPLQDMVKLKQDSGFGWSLNLYEADYDRTKVQLALRYLDRRLDAAFAVYDFYRNHYGLFQVLNLMRILPYCKHDRSAAFITAHLDALLKTIPRPNPSGAAPASAPV